MSPTAQDDTGTRLIYRDNRGGAHGHRGEITYKLPTAGCGGGTECGSYVSACLKGAGGVSPACRGLHSERAARHGTAQHSSSHQITTQHSTAHPAHPAHSSAPAFSSPAAASTEKGVRASCWPRQAPWETDMISTAGAARALWAGGERGRERVCMRVAQHNAQEMGWCIKRLGCKA